MCTVAKVDSYTAARDLCHLPSSANCGDPDVAAIVGGASYAFSASHPKVYRPTSYERGEPRPVDRSRETQIALRCSSTASERAPHRERSASKQHLTHSALIRQSRIFVFETASTGILE